jgi:hypothetical protein
MCKLFKITKLIRSKMCYKKHWMINNKKKQALKQSNKNKYKIKFKS